MTESTNFRHSSFFWLISSNFLHNTFYIVGMGFRIPHTFAVLCLASILWAQDLSKPVSDVQIFRPEKRESNIQLVDSSKANTVLLNVDIFGSLDVGSYYILWDMVDLSEDIKKLMTTRDFARDDFFMQNIDREQFEQERILQLFEDRKREFFAIFPEEALKELQEKQEDEE